MDLVTSTKRSRRSSHTEDWEDLYLCHRVGDFFICLYCRTQFTCLKGYNLKRHSILKHVKFDKDYPPGSDRRAVQIEFLKKNHGKPLAKIPKPQLNLDSESASRIAFEIAQDMAERKEPFSHSEIFRERLRMALRVIYEGTEQEKPIADFVQSIPLSRRSITRRIQLITENVHNQQLQSSDEYCAFSIQLDGSIDIRSVEQISASLRVVNQDGSTAENFFACLPLHEDTSGEAIYKALKTELLKTNLPLQKLVSITTDGAASTVECNNGLFARVRADPDFHEVTSFHCILHQLSLAAKSLEEVGVIEEVSHIVNSIVTEPLRLRLYQEYIVKLGIKLDDLVDYTGVRWLSKGIMLDRFHQHLSALVGFLKSRDETCIYLTETRWLIRFTYLTDILQMINISNKNMQGGNKFIGDYFVQLDRLKAYMTTAIQYLERNTVPPTFCRLKQLIQEIGVSNFSGENLVKYTQNFLDSVSERFADFSDVRTIVNYLENPFDPSILACDLIPIIMKLHPVDELELLVEIDTLRVNSRLKVILEIGGNIWLQIIENTLYPVLILVYKRTRSYFGSSYLCKT